MTVGSPGLGGANNRSDARAGPKHVRRSETRRPGGRWLVPVRRFPAQPAGACPSSRSSRSPAPASERLHERAGRRADRRRRPSAELAAIADDGCARELRDLPRLSRCALAAGTLEAHYLALVRSGQVARAAGLPRHDGRRDRRAAARRQRRCHRATCRPAAVPGRSASPSSTAASSAPIASTPTGRASRRASSTSCATARARRRHPLRRCRS